MNFTKIITPALFSALAITALCGQNAFASTTHHSFVGVKKSELNVGAQATIQTPGDTWISTGYSSSAWVMSDDSNGVYAQTGWVESPNLAGRYYFFETSKDDGNNYYIYFSNTTNGGFYDGVTSNDTYGAVGPALYSTHIYKVWEDSGSLNGVWQGSVDGAFSNNFYGTLPITTNTNEVEYMEEVNNITGAYFFGSQAVKTYFSSLGYLTFDSNYNQVLNPIGSISTGEVSNSSGYGGIDTSNLQYGRFGTYDTRN